MVSPIYIIAIPLGAAFLLPLMGRSTRWPADTLLILSLSALVFISGGWLYHFVTNPGKAVSIFTAGVKPPLSINLRMGAEEAFFLFSVHILFLLGALYMMRFLDDTGSRAKALLLAMVLGISGLIMTRDIFNMFIFLEILSISSYALVGMDLRLKSLSAGFKYAVVGSISSIFLLLGVIFLYSLTGTLNLDGMISGTASLPTVGVVSVALFLVFFTFFIEMKQFPVNGWALDVYEASNPGTAALIASGSSAAIFFAVYKLLPLLGEVWMEVFAIAGLVTFVVSNLIGLRQKSTTRLLGYSSIAQMGLLLSVLGLGETTGLDKNSIRFVVAALFINHFIAKAGLYWLAGIVKKDSIYEWHSAIKGMRLKLLFALLLLSLAGFPPFTGFWGKWTLITGLAGQGLSTWIFFILLGSLLEVVYLFRWFGLTVSLETSMDGLEETVEKADAHDDEGASIAQKHPATVENLATDKHKGMEAPIWIFAILSLAIGYLTAVPLLNHRVIILLPLAATVVLFFLDFLPAKAKGVISIAAIAAFAYLYAPELSGLNVFFFLLFLSGGGVLMIASLSRDGRSTGFFPLSILMIGSMSFLAVSRTMLEFFLSWELMTVSSYFLIIRGKDSRKPSLTYLIFSQAAAFSMLAGFALAIKSAAGSTTAEITLLSTAPLSTFILLAAAFMIKTASIGVHIWAPPAYSEAEDDVTPVISGVLSKAGILGLVTLFIQMGSGKVGSISINTVIGWLGVLTAFFATLYAVFQEDAKKLLAWSSVGQVGYIVLGLSVMSHLGWLAAMWHTVNHLLFKGLLFLAIAGVIYRTGTRNMYEMGGLIKKMPLSFVSVLIGIITLAGMPPLSGFGGKWLLYEALIEKGWLLQAALVFFASTIAFLYCFRLIHTIFLGQPKPRFRNVKEAPMTILAPQFILMLAIMLLSVFPGLLVKRLSASLEPFFTTSVHWKGLTLFSSLGYWNGTIIMVITMAVFILVAAYLFIFSPRPQKVKPFNIVFAGEKPYLPETTHYAYRFFRPYERAMSPLLRPLVKRFWHGLSEWSNTLAGAVRQIYTGDGQTYVLYIFIVGVLLYFFSSGVD